EEARLSLCPARLASDHRGGGHRRGEEVLVGATHDLAQVRAGQQAMGSQREEPAARPGETEPLVLRGYALPGGEDFAGARRGIGQDPRALLLEPLRLSEEPQ